MDFLNEYNDESSNSDSSSIVSSANIQNIDKIIYNESVENQFYDDVDIEFLSKCELWYITYILRNDKYRRYEPVWKKNENDTIPYFDLRENKPRFVNNDIEFECFKYFLGYIHSTFCQDPFFYIDRSDHLHGNGLCLNTKQDISYRDLKEKLVGKLEHLNEYNFTKYYQFPAFFQDIYG